MDKISKLKDIIREEVQNVLNETIKTHDPSDFEPDVNSREPVERVLGSMGVSSTRNIREIGETEESGEWMISWEEPAKFGFEISELSNISGIDDIIIQQSSRGTIVRFWES